jgi:hypothetical protein
MQLCDDQAVNVLIYTVSCISEVQKKNLFSFFQVPNSRLTEVQMMRVHYWTAITAVPGGL